MEQHLADILQMKNIFKMSLIIIIIYLTLHIKIMWKLFILMIFLQILLIYYLIAAAVIVFDRVVKKLVVSNMVPWETIPVIEDIFHFTYVQNRGAAFSMWQGQWIILIGFPLAAIAVGLILIYLKRNKWDKLMLTSVAMICGGGLGNLIDRIMLGYVVDLFDFRVFPVFNIADIFICVGCGLMILDVLFFERKNSSNE